MKDIWDYIEDTKYKNEYRINEIMTNDDGNVSCIYWEDPLLYYCAIAPHKGTDYRYLLRVHPKISFDRWSIAAYQEYANTERDIINYLTTYKEEIYKECLEDISRDYEEEFADREYWQDQYYELKNKEYNEQ